MAPFILISQAGLAADRRFHSNGRARTRRQFNLKSPSHPRQPLLHVRQPIPHPLPAVWMVRDSDPIIRNFDDNRPVSEGKLYPDLIALRVFYCIIQGFLENEEDIMAFLR